MTAMTANKSIDATAAAKLPPVSGTPVFLNAKQSTDAANYLAANWAQAVK
jgi:putative spermidine/putrescine transport system substrate-binding protein